MIIHFSTKMPKPDSEFIQKSTPKRHAALQKLIETIHEQDKSVE